MSMSTVNLTKYIKNVIVLISFYKWQDNIMYAIYKISFMNIVYIGMTSQKRLNRRWYEHKWQANNNGKYYLYRAMRKYGIDGFIFEHIACCKTIDDALFLEKLLIIQYDSFGVNGFNLTEGGDSPSWITDKEIMKYNSKEHSSRMKDKWGNAEFREKMSISLKGIKRSTEAREAQSKRMKGIPLSKQCMDASLKANIGSKRSEETINKLCIAQNKRFLDPNEHEKISIATKEAMKNPEIRLKISIAQKGRKSSKETIKKQTISSSGVYRITFESGDSVIISNLNKWCKDNPQYSYHGIRLVSKGIQLKSKDIIKCEVIIKGKVADERKNDYF